MLGKKADDTDVEEAPFKLGSHLKPITKKLIVKFSGSLNDFAEDDARKEWKIKTSRVFGIDPEDEEQVGTLEDGILIGVEITKVQSTFPCDLNLDFKDVSQKNYSFDDGSHVHYIVHPKEVNHSLNEVIMEPSAALNSNYLKDHSRYTPKNLFHDVVAIPKAPFSYVGKTNPLIKIINSNSERLKVTLTSNDLIDDMYYKVDNDVLYDVAESLQEELWQTFPITDLTKFAIGISRPSGLEFNDPTGICDNLTGDKAINAVMNSTRDLTCVVKITYSLPQL